MATVTPNYSWPVPTSTDLVKDGASAIEALGDAIDATVFALPSSGMTLINTTTFSAVSSQSINNVFTSTYQNYQIILNVTNKSAVGAVNFRYRASGTDSTTAVYNQAGFYSTSNSGQGYDVGVNQTQFNSWGTQNTGKNISLIANVFNPEIAATSDMTLHYFGGDVNGFYFNYLASNTYQATTSFDGFTLISASGTITGTVRVYGVKN